MSAPPRPWLLFFGLAALLLALGYAGHLDGEYVWDDVYLVEQNASLSEPGGLRRIFTTDLWGSAGQTPSQLFHPLPMASFWAQAQLGLLTVPISRLVNLGLHLLCGAGLLLLLLRWAVPTAAALLVALVFLVHPSSTEPVLWLTGRHDLLGVLFSLGALLLWPRSGSRAPTVRALLAGLCCGAALLCKEPYIVTPALLAAQAWAQGLPSARSRYLAVARLAPSIAAVLAVLAWRRALGIHSGSDQLAAPLGEHLRNYASIVWHYGVQLLGLAQGPTIESFAALGGVAAALVLVGAVAALGLALRLGARLATFGLVWFLVALAPHTMSLPAIGQWGNRYAYFPLAGLGLVVGAIALAARDGALTPRWVRGLSVLGALAILACAARTRAGAAAWHDDLSLYMASVEARPTDGRALYHYGHALRRRSGCAPAVPVFAEAARQAPDYPRAWRNLAGCLINLGRPADAVEPARHALALEPGDASHHYNLGAALVLSGDKAAGARELEAALRIAPSHAQAAALLRETR